MIVLDSGRIAGVPHLQHVSTEMTISASRGAFVSEIPTQLSHSARKLPEHSHLLSRLRTSVRCEQSWHEEPDASVPSGPLSGWQVCGKTVACIQPTMMSFLRDWNNTRTWDLTLPQHCCWGLRYFGLLLWVAGLLTANDLSSSSRTPWHLKMGAIHSFQMCEINNLLLGATTQRSWIANSRISHYITWVHFYKKWINNVIQFSKL
jgi:hypothetical protein